MKKFRILTSLILFGMTVVLIGCSKEQIAVNKIEGTWKVTKTIDDWDGTTTYNNRKRVFTKCKLKKSEWCDGNAIAEDGENYFMQYKLIDKGSTLVIKYTSSTYTYEVKTLTKEELVYSSNSTTFYLAKE